jgi:uncharacterized RDD family membrane protein YckC
VTEVLPARARAFQGLRSGPVSRTLASIIDVGVAALATAGVVLGWSLIASLGDRAFALSIPGPLGAFLLGETLLTIYLWVGWATTGRTIGKQVMGLRVVNHRGELMRPGGALLRALACVVFPVGLLWSLFSSHNRSLQDVVLRTSVIYDWNARLPARSTRPAPVDAGEVNRESGA